MMKSAGPESGQAGNAGQPKRRGRTFDKPQTDKRPARGTETELGPGSELDAIPPDASRERLPPDAADTGASKGGH